MGGLAIGQRLAPSLAIAFMPKVEAPMMDLRPLLYFQNGASDSCPAQHFVLPGIS
ncbi:hypothetical protein KIN20_028346 [Parelaphostrongylus tenuis]|uniref:Uncharacterized protein n=1 Tax=Parelaphostrongylus tenuis TaxID=148309 RepID=A0AAD5R0Z7_PARTN|nr:hypothetical protein KIN20_028346 [Parelaphostrongylus tenuis]